MAKQYATLVHEWFEEVWNQRKVETIDRLLAVDAVIHGLTDENGNELRGPKAFREFHGRFVSSFPNLQVEVADTISQGDKIAGRCIVRGKHSGDGLGFAATQKQTEFTGMCIAVVKNGKIVEAWNNFDFLTLYTQLGVLNSV